MLSIHCRSIQEVLVATSEFNSFSILLDILFYVEVSSRPLDSGVSIERAATEYDEAIAVQYGRGLCRAVCVCIRHSD